MTHPEPETTQPRTASDADSTPTAAGDVVPFGQATKAWFLISLQTFGGPAGQIAVMQRTLVDEKRWIGLRRFIDDVATFGFVTDIADVPAGTIPFDMRGVDFTHHGDDCTFETLLRRHDLLDPVLWRIAAIVHEADLEDDRYDAPEAAGLDVVLRGL